MGDAVGGEQGGGRDGDGSSLEQVEPDSTPTLVIQAFLALALILATVVLNSLGNSDSCDIIQLEDDCVDKHIQPCGGEDGFTRDRLSEVNLFECGLTPETHLAFSTVEDAACVDAMSLANPATLVRDSSVGMKCDEVLP